MTKPDWGELIRDIQSRTGMDDAIAGIVFEIPFADFAEVRAGRKELTEFQARIVSAFERYMEFLPCEDEV